VPVIYFAHWFANSLD